MPGTSGLISPFTDLNGLYFDDSNEVDDFSYQLDKDLQEKFNKEGLPYVTINQDTSDKFYDMILEIQDFNKQVTATGVAHEGTLQIVQDQIKDMDEASTISHPKKKKAEKEREAREEAEKQRKLDEAIAKAEAEEAARAKKEKEKPEDKE